MFRVRDTIVIPIILIPVLIYCLIFSRKEKELMLSIFLVSVGVILSRYLDFSGGWVIAIIGVLFLNFVDRDYRSSRLSFITSHTNPTFLKYYDKLISCLKEVFNPLFEFRYFNILSELFYWGSALLLMLVLIRLMLVLNKNFASFVFSMIVPIGAFLWGCFVDRH